jgi:apolipoprotein D and lipocalin family protein
MILLSKVRLFAFVLVIVFFCSLAGAQDGKDSRLNSIESLDLQRYLGQWYEIAKYPNWFQKKCKSDTKAHYSLRADGHVAVLNLCRQEDGQVSSALGEAVQVGDDKSPKLRVRFAPQWMSIFPFVWGDYWIVDIDQAYQLVAVSEPKREYLWILSRTPEPDDLALNRLMLRLVARGFDLSRLERTPHKQDIVVK